MSEEGSDESERPTLMELLKRAAIVTVAFHVGIN